MSAEERVESDYYAFMGFDAENAAKVLGYYTKYFTESPVVELACGYGVFLGLLRDAGIEARGVDLDDGMVEKAREAGHDVTLDDALTFLEAQADDSVAGLFAAHFLEHLPAEVVQRVYREAARVLRPGGVFVAVVPNAACLSVLGYDFWRDPTHVRFYDPLALEFFAREAGLTVVESGGNPQNHPGAPPELRPMATSSGGDLKPGAIELVQHATHAIRTRAQAEQARIRRLPGQRGVAAAQRRAADAEADVNTWAELGHIIGLMAERIQSLQHDVSALRSTNERLLAQLYPPNEVYVVAHRPAQGGIDKENDAT